MSTIFFDATTYLEIDTFLAERCGRVILTTKMGTKTTGTTMMTRTATTTKTEVMMAWDKCNKEDDDKENEEDVNLIFDVTTNLTVGCIPGRERVGVILTKKRIQTSRFQHLQGH